MTNIDPEALAEWHDEQADEHERTSETVTASLAYGWASYAAKHRTTAALLRELVELRAKLPKTADGVTYLPNDPLFLPRSGIRVIGVGYMMAIGQDPGKWPVCAPGWRICDCYSTEAAALAAKETSND